MHKFLSSLVLGVSLLAPIGTVYADDHHDQAQHQWNDRENDAWRRYLKAQHKKDHDWDKASKREQAAYWRWRDKHPDAH